MPRRCGDKLALSTEQFGLGTLQGKQPRFPLVSLLVKLLDANDLLSDQFSLSLDALELPRRTGDLLFKLSNFLNQRANSRVLSFSLRVSN